MLLAEVAPKVVGALAADRHDLDGLALGDQPLGVGPRQLCDIRIEAAAQTALGRHHDQEMRLILAGSDEQRRSARFVRRVRSQIGEHAVHAFGVGARRLRRVLRAAQFRCGDHLHRFGDLARRLHGSDAVAHVLQARHRASRSSSQLRSSGRRSGSRSLGGEPLGELVEEGHELFLGFGRHRFFLGDRIEDRFLAAQRRQHSLLELADRRDRRCASR